ncbi:MAG: pilin [Patescibacteria group bacterium]
MRLTFLRILILLPLFCLILFSFPSSSQAQGALTWDKTKCACYFSAFNGTVDAGESCEMVPIATGSKEKACELTCKNKYPTTYIKHQFATDDNADIQSACTTSFAKNKKELADDPDAVVPKLEIKIPGLEFAPAQKSNSLFSSGFLSQYIAGLYQYLLGIAAAIAVVMVLIGGFQYVLGAGAKAQIEKGKERIKNGVIGLILLLSVFFILKTVNPQLVILRNLKVQIPPRYELEDVLDQTAGNDKDPDGKVIEKLLGGLNPDFEKCSKEAAMDTAKRLTELNVCVGPCHCAYTSSRFLRYIGCGNVLNGSAYYEALNLDKRGWVTETVGAPDYASQYVGMAFMKGHAGVMLGDGRTFDSGAAVASPCPGNFQDTLGLSEPCKECSKIPEEAPFTGRFGAPALGGTFGSGTCTSNQQWTLRPKGSPQWRAVIRPLQPGEVDHKRICCDLGDAWKPKKWYITDTLCQILKGETPAESTDGNEPQISEDCSN